MLLTRYFHWASGFDKSFYNCDTNEEFVSFQCKLFSSLVDNENTYNMDENTNSTNSNNAVLEFIHPETGCEIVLVGVIHGSTVSANDVQAAIQSSSSNSNPTDVVVLELCSCRFADMKRGTVAQQQQQQQQQGFNLSVKPKSRGEKFLNSSKKLSNLVAITAKKKGLPSAAAALLIGGVSLLQAALSGFTPGLEFITAIEEVEKLNPQGCDIILADRDVTETLSRFAQLPSVSFRYFRDIIVDRKTEKVKDESKSLMRAIFGDTSIPHQIKLGTAMTNSQEMRNDVFKLTVPPAIIMTVAANTIGSFTSSPMQAFADSSVSGADFLSDKSSFSLLQSSYLINDFIIDFGVSSVILIIFYLFVALPSTQVIISERDEFLANGIEAACRVASESKDDNENDLAFSYPSSHKVVAVLGMLHLNGVAARLLTDSLEAKTSS
jgi:pheromone shutdown protein TraB